jgi:hypothetical protein
MFFPSIVYFLLAVNYLDPSPLKRSTIRAGTGTPSIRTKEKEILSCRVRSYYPFSGTPRGLSGFLFKDVHTAIEITTSVAGQQKMMLDFMTKDGQAADVWSNEFLQLAVLLGASIPGEIRLLGTGKRAKQKNGQQLSPQLQRIMEFSEKYDTEMNIYLNNCQTFTRKMEREVERLNHVNLADSSSSPSTRSTVCEEDQAQISNMDMDSQRRGVLAFLGTSGAGVYLAPSPASALLDSNQALLLRPDNDNTGTTTFQLEEALLEAVADSDIGATLSKESTELVTRIIQSLEQKSKETHYSLDRWTGGWDVIWTDRQDYIGGPFRSSVGRKLFPTISSRQFVIGEGVDGVRTESILGTPFGRGKHLFLTREGTVRVLNDHVTVQVDFPPIEGFLLESFSSNNATDVSLGKLGPGTKDGARFRVTFLSDRIRIIRGEAGVTTVFQRVDAKGLATK